MSIKELIAKAFYPESDTTLAPQKFKALDELMRLREDSKQLRLHRDDGKTQKQIVTSASSDSFIHYYSEVSFAIDFVMLQLFYRHRTYIFSGLDAQHKHVKQHFDLGKDASYHAISVRMIERARLGHRPSLVMTLMHFYQRATRFYQNGMVLSSETNGVNRLSTLALVDLILNVNPQPHEQSQCAVQLKAYLDKDKQHHDLINILEGQWDDVRRSLVWSLLLQDEILVKTDTRLSWSDQLNAMIRLSNKQLLVFASKSKAKHKFMAFMSESAIAKITTNTTLRQLLRDVGCCERVTTITQRPNNDELSYLLCLYVTRIRAGQFNLIPKLITHLEQAIRAGLPDNVIDFFLQNLVFCVEQQFKIQKLSTAQAELEARVCQLFRQFVSARLTRQHKTSAQREDGARTLKLIYECANQYLKHLHHSSTLRTALTKLFITLHANMKDCVLVSFMDASYDLLTQDQFCHLHLLAAESALGFFHLPWQITDIYYPGCRNNSLKRILKQLFHTNATNYCQQYARNLILNDVGKGFALFQLIQAKIPHLLSINVHKAAPETQCRIGLVLLLYYYMGEALQLKAHEHFEANDKPYGVLSYKCLTNLRHVLKPLIQDLLLFAHLQGFEPAAMIMRRLPASWYDFPKFDGIEAAHKNELDQKLTQDFTSLSFIFEYNFDGLGDIDRYLLLKILNPTSDQNYSTPNHRDAFAQRLTYYYNRYTDSDDPKNPDFIEFVIDSFRQLSDSISKPYRELFGFLNRTMKGYADLECYTRSKGAWSHEIEALRQNPDFMSQDGVPSRTHLLDYNDMRQMVDRVKAIQSGNPFKDSYTHVMMFMSYHTQWTLLRNGYNPGCYEYHLQSYAMMKMVDLIFAQRLGYKCAPDPLKNAKTHEYVTLRKALEVIDPEEFETDGQLGPAMTDAQETDLVIRAMSVIGGATRIALLASSLKKSAQSTAAATKSMKQPNRAVAQTSMFAKPKGPKDEPKVDYSRLKGPMLDRTF